jgi:hypothetical protein
VIPSHFNASSMSRKTATIAFSSWYAAISRPKPNICGSLATKARRHVALTTWRLARVMAWSPEMSNWGAAVASIN